MNPAFGYLAKVVLCSGVLFGYYCLALRNKVFHQWNRFYLLACVVLSLLAPLLTIHIGSGITTQDSQVLRMLQFVNTGNDVRVESSSPGSFMLSTKQWVMLAYMLVTLLVCSIIVTNGFRIYSILRSFPKTKLNHIYFLNTPAKGTPFSFFHYIVWNRAIDLNSENGQRIFQHELVHVEQRHTWDKVFLLLVLVPFWANPFFWLIRRELTALHEFAADQKAMQSGDAAALAQVILNTMFPEQHFLFTNHFFQSTIKRRLAMFTKLQNPKVSYWSRIIALPILFFVVAAFSIKTKPITKAAQDVTLKNDDLLQKVTLPVVKDTTPNTGDPTVKNDPAAEAKTFSGVIVIDGNVFKGTMKDIPLTPDQIASVNVWKENDALVKEYGPQAQGGVIKIITKATSNSLHNDTSIKPVFTKTEVEPQFPGGKVGWQAFLGKNLNATVGVINGAKAGNYKVIVQFIVDENGALSAIKPITNNGYGMEEEVVRLMKSSPNWIPATQNGRIVKAYWQQPVTFVIAESK